MSRQFTSIAELLDHDSESVMDADEFDTALWLLVLVLEDAIDHELTLNFFRYPSSLSPDWQEPSPALSQSGCEDDQACH
jgi:hypothetical protein